MILSTKHCEVNENKTWLNWELTSKWRVRWWENPRGIWCILRILTVSGKDAETQMLWRRRAFEFDWNVRNMWPRAEIQGETHATVRFLCFLFFFLTDQLSRYFIHIQGYEQMWTSVHKCISLTQKQSWVMITIKNLIYLKISIYVDSEAPVITSK